MKNTLACIVALIYLTILPKPAFATSSTVSLTTSTITTSTKEYFDADSIPTIELSSHSSISQNFAKFFNSLRGKSSTSLATLTNPQGETIIEQPIKSGTTNSAGESSRSTPTKSSYQVGETYLRCVTQRTSHTL
jgi:hypothetical protein